MAEPAPWPQLQPQSLCEVLDRVLDTGAVLDGQIVLSVAGVDLVFIGLRALIASVDSAGRLMRGSAAPEVQP